MVRGGLVVVRGAGDIGSAVVHRLCRAGFRVAALELPDPLVIRRTVSFAQAVLDGRTVVEGVEGRLTTLDEVASLASRGEWPDWVPVLVDPDGEALRALHPDALVDARLAKVNLGTSRDDAPVTIGLGPGFEAGGDVDYVVETKRGHTLGRLMTSGAPERDTGIPGEVGGVAEERVIRSPSSGRFRSARSIGDLVAEGEVVGTVGGTEVRARIGGLLRGLIADGTVLREGQKMGDVDPRGRETDHTLLSDKARAVAGAVLEGLLMGGVLPDRGGTRCRDDV